MSNYTLKVGRVGPECVNNFASSLHLNSGTSKAGTVSGPGNPLPKPWLSVRFQLGGFY